MTDLSEPHFHSQSAKRSAARAERPRRGPWLQLFDPVGFEWNKVVLPIPNLADALVGLRIVQISDLHLRGRWLKALDELLQRVGDQPPDLLICTGDFVENKRSHAPALPHVLRLLAGLKARLGRFGVLGNHDGNLAKDLSPADITLLDHKRQTIGLGGATIELIGLPRLLRREKADPKFVPALAPGKPGDVRIVLSHHPDYLPLCSAIAPDLFLTGHTHGGQVCLPGGFPMLTHSPLPRSQCSGIHKVGPTQLIANRGFGFSGLPVRLFCPSEVIEIELARG